MKRQATLLDAWVTADKKKLSNSQSCQSKQHDEPSSNIRKLEGIPNEFIAVDVPSDGNCLFSALSRQLAIFNVLKASGTIRQEIVDFMATSQEFSKPEILPNGIDIYLKEMACPGCWGDGNVLSAAYLLYGYPIVVYFPNGSKINIGNESNNCASYINIAFINNNHFISLEKLDHIEQVNTELSYRNSASSGNVPPTVDASSELTDVNSLKAQGISANDKIIFEPNQPDKIFPTKKYCGKNRRLLFTYFSQFPWLHWVDEKAAVMCYICCNVSILGQKVLATKCESAFIDEGFSCWKEPINSFRTHEQSAMHRECELRWWQYTKGKSIDNLLKLQIEEDQILNKEVLRTIITSLRYLARQGLAIRGHEETEGNFKQLLELRSDDKISIKNFLKGEQRCKYVSHDIQNEILKDMSLQVVRNILSRIKQFKFYSIIADETTDSQGKQQMCIAFRWVDDSLKVHEDFVGLYEVSDASAKGIGELLLDTITRCGLSLSDLRGQGYDGCSVMV